MILLYKKSLHMFFTQCKIIKQNKTKFNFYFYFLMGFVFNIMNINKNIFFVGANIDANDIDHDNEIVHDNDNEIVYDQAANPKRNVLTDIYNRIAVAQAQNKATDNFNFIQKFRNIYGKEPNDKLIQLIHELNADITEKYRNNQNVEADYILQNCKNQDFDISQALLALSEIAEERRNNQNTEADNFLHNLKNECPKLYTDLLDLFLVKKSLIVETKSTRFKMCIVKIAACKQLILDKTRILQLCDEELLKYNPYNTMHNESLNKLERIKTFDRDNNKISIFLYDRRLKDGDFGYETWTKIFISPKFKYFNK